MSFEIRNPKGKIINLRDLDQEACDLWQIARDPRHYAHPPLEHHWTNSWHSNIGWAIENPYEPEKGWEDVKCVIWTAQVRDLYKILFESSNTFVGSHFLSRMENTKSFIAPYFELIDHWQSKGYIPVNIKH